MIDAETRKEFDAAIEWLESQAEYDDGIFINYSAPYSSYMANVKYDTCAREGWDDYCPVCHPQSRVPKHITGLPWTDEDEEIWLSQGDPGSWARLGEYFTERGYYVRSA